MPAKRVTKDDESTDKVRRPLGTTPQAVENQMIAASYDLAAQQIREGKASSQVITHFLKLGSSRERLEQQRLAGEVDILAAKREMMNTAARIEEKYDAALEAMRSYTGQEQPTESQEQFDD